MYILQWIIIKKLESHRFSLYLPRGFIPLNSLGDLLSIYSCQKANIRSLGTNLPQFLKHFPFSKVYDLIPNSKWLYRKIPVTRDMSERQLIFPFGKEGEIYTPNEPANDSKKFGASKKFSDPVCFPPNESPTYRANARESWNTPYVISLSSFSWHRDFP